MRQLADKIVDGLLDPNSDDGMAEFVGQALSQTDPLTELDSHHVMSNGLIEAWYRHAGRYWNGRIQFTYEPSNGDFCVYATLESVSWHEAIQGSSYWGVTPKDLPLVREAIKKLCPAFDRLTDMKPTPTLPGPMKVALDEVMLILDDVFKDDQSHIYPRI